MSVDLTPPPEVLAAFDLDARSLERATSGLINPTWFARSTDGASLVLQCVNPIFSAEVNVDIEAVSNHLAAKGFLTPRLVPTRSGGLWQEYEGTVWRVLTRIDGICRDALETPAQARAAGQLLAQFHRAVRDLEHTFRNRRLGVHDTPRHMRLLREALVAHRGHRHFAAIEPLAERVLAQAAELPPLPPMPDRIVHGDPKISNLLFSRDGTEGLCLIDLDTLGPMPIALELGDALRSWCNPATEDATQARFMRPFFDAAIEGYAEAARGFLSETEWRSIPLGTLTISTELAARFCADALNERYFGWNRARYASASEHNQARTEGQLRLAAALAAALPALEDSTAAAFSR